MANVYSERFILGHAGAGGSYTVPAGYRAVVRFASAFNASGVAPESTQLVIAGAAVTIWQVLTAPSSSDFFDGRVVMNAGETLDAVTDADVDVSVSGYLLSLP